MPKMIKYIYLCPLLQQVFSGRIWGSSKYMTLLGSYDFVLYILWPPIEGHVLAVSQDEPGDVACLSHGATKLLIAENKNPMVSLCLVISMISIQQDAFLLEYMYMDIHHKSGSENMPNWGQFEEIPLNQTTIYWHHRFRCMVLTNSQLEVHSTVGER